MPQRQRPPRTRAPQPALPPQRSFIRVHAWVLAAIVAVLFATTDDRHVGLIADGRQMIWTAVAIAETGSIGQARARDLTFPRDGGDSVSRYGMGMSLAQLPAAWLAPYVEGARGAGSSQPLFLIAPFLFVLAAALCAGIAARELGTGVGGQRAAILLSTLASPLGAYAAMELSEPLQAAALGATFASALVARRLAGAQNRAAWRSAAAAGAAIGVAVLTKSSLLFVAPLALLPWVASPRRAKLAASAAIGFAPVVALWLAFEILRFGHPFASYAGERFSHPFLDGAWRLLVGVNKGMLLYFPALIAVGIALVRALRGRRRIADQLGAVAPFAALLALAAPWWAWHGVDGWGPRLIVPAIPLLAASAAAEIETWRRLPAVALLCLSTLANIPPLLQHPTPVVRYLWACDWPQDDAIAQQVPRFARRDAGGRMLVPPDQVLATVPQASPFILLPWFFDITHEPSGAAAAARLQSPPWLTARPDIRPPAALSADEARAITRRARWNFWGRGFAPGPDDAGYASVYDWGLADQILRAQQQRRLDAALRLARERIALAPDGFADALLLETYRLLERDRDAVEYLTGLPRDRRSHPAINVVLALWERDRGREPEARQLLESVAADFPGSPVQAALTAPLSAWPSDFAAMTADLSLEIAGR